MRQLLISGLLLLSALALAGTAPTVAADCNSNLLPWVEAGDDMTVEIFELATFDQGDALDDDGHIDLYEWDFEGDGTYDYSNEDSPHTTWTYSELGLKDAILRVTDDCGATVTDQILVDVVDNNKPPVADAGDNVITEAGQLTTLFGSGVDEDGIITKYEWDFTDDGVYDSSASKNGTASTVYFVPGKYTARLKVTDSGNIPANDTDSINIEVLPLNLPPEAEHGDGGSKRSTYALLTLEFQPVARDPDGKITKYEWDFDGDGKVDHSASNSGTATWTYTKSGTYKASFTVTDNGPLVKTASVEYTITVREENQPPNADAGADLEVLVGDPVSLEGTGSDTDGQVISYRWDFDGDGTVDLGNTESGKGVTTFERAGIYKAVFSVVDDAGAVTADEVTITVSEPVVVKEPEPPLLEFDLGFIIALGIGIGAGVAVGLIVGRSVAIKVFERRLKNVQEIESSGGSTRGDSIGGGGDLQGGAAMLDEGPGFRGGGLPPGGQGGAGGAGGYQQPPQQGYQQQQQWQQPPGGQY